MKRFIGLIVAVLTICACSAPEPVEQTGQVQQPVTFSGSTVGQPNNYHGTCQGDLAPEKFFTWVAPRSGTATFSTCNSGTNYDTVIYARKNTITGAQLFCNDDRSANEECSQTTATVVACTTYYLFVDGWSTSAGNFSLVVTPPSGTPANCGDAGTDSGVDAGQDARDAIAEEGAADGGVDTGSGDAGNDQGDAADATEVSDDASSIEGGDEADSGTDSSATDDSGEAGDGDGGQVDSGSDGGSDGGGTLTVYPVKTLPGVHYLVDQQNNPFFIQGDAAWSLIAQLSDEDVELYAADRQARGVNTVIVNLIEHKFASHAPANFYNVQPFTTPGDFSTPNEPYFVHADHVLQVLASHHIQALLFPAYLGNGGGDEGWYGEEENNGLTKMANWGTWVGNRYKNTDNIVWVLGGDFSPSDPAIVNVVGNAIQAADGRHLTSFHGSSWTETAWGNFGGQSWLTLDSVYEYPQPAGNVGPTILAEYGGVPAPTFLIESQYENEFGATRDVVRRQSWESVLNGGTGQVYGNGPIWCFSAPTCFVGGDWHAQLNSLGAQDQMKLFSFFSTRSWWKLAPDSNHRCLTAGSSGTSTEMATDTSWCASFLPSAHQVTVGLANFSTPRLMVSWYNPSTGVYSPITNIPFANIGSVATSPPGSGDWVLVVE